MTFKEQLLKLRKENNMSQEELAEKLGVSRQAVSKWEVGTASPELANLKALCELFNVSPNEILGYDISKYQAPSLEKKRMPAWIKVILIVIAVFLALGIGGGMLFYSMYALDLDGGTISIEENDPVILFDAKFVSVESLGHSVNMHKFRIVFMTEYAYDEEDIFLDVYNLDTGKTAEYGVRKDGPYFIAEVPLHFGSNVIISACYPKGGEEIIGRELVQISNISNNEFDYNVR